MGILLPLTPPAHRNCFPGIGYVTCPAIENECHPVATLLHVIGICVVLSWLRPLEEMQPWWLLLDELAPGQFATHASWTVADSAHLHELTASAAPIQKNNLCQPEEQHGHCAPYPSCQTDA